MLITKIGASCAQASAKLPWKRMSTSAPMNRPPTARATRAVPAEAALNSTANATRGAPLRCSCCASWVPARSATQALASRLTATRPCSVTGLMPSTSTAPPASSTSRRCSARRGACQAAAGLPQQHAAHHLHQVGHGVGQEVRPLATPAHQQQAGAQHQVEPGHRQQRSAQRVGQPRRGDPGGAEEQLQHADKGPQGQSQHVTGRHRPPLAALHVAWRKISTRVQPAPPLPRFRRRRRCRAPGLRTSTHAGRCGAAAGDSWRAAAVSWRTLARHRTGYACRHPPLCPPLRPPLLPIDRGLRC